MSDFDDPGVGFARFLLAVGRTTFLHVELIGVDVGPARRALLLLYCAHLRRPREHGARFLVAVCRNLPYAKLIGVNIDPPTALLPRAYLAAAGSGD